MADTFLRLPQVMERTGLCRSAVYGTEGFPSSVKLGGRRAVAWVSSEVDAWIQRTIAASRPVSRSNMDAESR
jgi:prophage regulatory protein